MPAVCCIKDVLMRFYDNDGLEMEIQEPKFFIDEELLQELKEAIEELWCIYV